MPSIVPGFEYDIFISYRHNDNRSGWVTEFIKSLQEELSATIKEPLSIYFDKNPHDGLLETHNVDKSLEGKLKCLIFIPIISQTYCDSKSFAWQHEFCAFNKLAKHDQFGRDIKLNNGNVASRILPVKIHDLDVEDKAIIEKEIGGVLRAIEFIFKAAGVNRPLRSQDDDLKEITHTYFYRDQVNKVANAIKEIISSFKSPSLQKPLRITNTNAIRPTTKRKVAISALIFLLISAAGFFLYPALISSMYANGEIDKSVAVLAFDDMSENKDQEWFSDGLTDEILNSLAKLKELKVTARTSSFYFKGKDVPLNEMALALGVAHIVEGSVRKIGDKMRITVQLIRASDGIHLWSNTYDRSAEDLFSVQADIAENVAKALLRELTPEKKQRMLYHEKPSNFEAYENFLKGVNIHLSKFWSSGGELIYFEESRRYFERALSLDPSYAEAYGALANLYDSRYNSGLMKNSGDTIGFKEVRDSLIKIGLRLDPNSPEVLISNQYRFLEKDMNDSAFFYLKRAYKNAPDRSITNHEVAIFYSGVGLDELALPFIEKAVKLDPLFPNYLTRLYWNQLYLGYYDDAKKTALRLLELDKGSPDAYKFLFQVSMLQDNRKEALQYIDQLILRSPSLEKNLQQYIDALNGKPDKSNGDLSLLSFMKLKPKFLKILDERTQSIGDGLIYYSLAGVLKNPWYDFVREEPEFKIILERLKKSHAIAIAKYGRLD